MHNIPTEEEWSVSIDVVVAYYTTDRTDKYGWSTSRTPIIMIDDFYMFCHIMTWRQHRLATRTQSANRYLLSVWRSNILHLLFPFFWNPPNWWLTGFIIEFLKPHNILLMISKILSETANRHSIVRISHLTNQFPQLTAVLIFHILQLLFQFYLFHRFHRHDLDNCKCQVTHILVDSSLYAILAVFEQP